MEFVRFVNNLRIKFLCSFVEMFQIVDGPNDLTTIEDQQALFKVELTREAKLFKFKWFKGDEELPKTSKKYKSEFYGNFAVLKVK